MQSGVFTGERGLSLEKWASRKRLEAGFVKSLWKSIDDPDEVPYLLEGLVDGFSKVKLSGKDAIRNSLIRIQVHCSIHSNSDPIKVSKQLFVAQMLERMFFGSNKLLTEGVEEEEGGR